MLVSELIEELKTLDPDSEVIIQTDEEGNGYEIISGVEGGNVFLPEDGIVKYKKLTSGLRQQGFTSEDVYDPDEDGEDAVDCVVIFP